MRKNLLSLAAVIIAVAGSAFTTPAHKPGKLVSYKWFHIITNRTTAQSVPSSGAEYLGEGETPPAPPAGVSCSGTNYQCISGFLPSQVNSSNQLNGTQMPQTVASTKN